MGHRRSICAVENASGFSGLRTQSNRSIAEASLLKILFRGVRKAFLSRQHNSLCDLDKHENVGVVRIFFRGINGGFSWGSQNIFPLGQKVVKFHVSRSKLRKQPFPATIFIGKCQILKPRVGLWLPFPTPRHEKRKWQARPHKVYSHLLTTARRKDRWSRFSWILLLLVSRTCSNAPDLTVVPKRVTRT